MVVSDNGFLFYLFIYLGSYNFGIPREEVDAATGFSR